MLSHPRCRLLDRDKPPQGVVAITLNLFRNGDVGFIDWLGPFHVATPYAVAAKRCDTEQQNGLTNAQCESCNRQ
jgi:hypothetical protein